MLAGDAVEEVTDLGTSAALVYIIHQVEVSNIQIEGADFLLVEVAVAKACLPAFASAFSDSIYIVITENFQILSDRNVQVAPRISAPLLPWNLM